MNILNKCTPKTIQSPAELLASSRPSPLAATSSCATLWHAASHMLQQAWLQRAWLQRAWNVLVTTSRQDKTSPVTHVAKCHNFWNHFSRTMQEHARASGLLWPFQCKGCFPPTPIPVPAYIFWTLSYLTVLSQSYSQWSWWVSVHNIVH